MTRSVVDLYPHDQAVLTALETIGKPVGFAEAPAGALEGVQEGTGPDYLVVFPLPSGLRDGNLADPYTDADLVYQITCVGRLASGARWLVSRVETALLGATITGRAVLQVIPEDPGAVRADTDVEPAVFIATPRFRIQTVPT